MWLIFILPTLFYIAWLLLLHWSLYLITCPLSPTIKSLYGIMSIIAITTKNNWPQCLVVFFIVILRFSAIRNLLSDLTLSEFPLLRTVEATYWILKSLLLEAAPIPPQNHSAGLSATFQLNSESNSSPQLTLQSSGV